MCEIALVLIVIGIVLAILPKRGKSVPPGDYGPEELREEFPDEFGDYDDDDEI